MDFAKIGLKQFPTLGTLSSEIVQFTVKIFDKLFVPTNVIYQPNKHFNGEYVRLMNQWGQSSLHRFVAVNTVINTRDQNKLGFTGNGRNDNELQTRLHICKLKRQRSSFFLG